MADDNNDVNRTRRQLLAVSAGLGTVGLACAAVPFAASMSPSERAKAAGAPVEVDISQLRPGEMKQVEWRGKVVWVLRRTRDMLKRLAEGEPLLSDPKSDKSDQPKYVDKTTRAIKDEYLVLVGICTHLGCSPTAKIQAGAESGLGKEWPGGFFCPCHGSKFDLAGRVYKNVPAPTNMTVPPYTFKDEKTIIVGIDPSNKDNKGAA